METENSLEKKVRRHSGKERAEILTRYRASGKSQRAFCAEAGISLGTLTLWLRRSRVGEVKGELIEVKLPEMAAAPLEIALGGSILVRVAAGTPAGWVAAVIKALRCGD